MKDFQTNDVSAPFNLFHLFDHYPALKAAWDSVPGGTGNSKMADMLNENIPIGAEFMKILSFLMDRADDPGLGMLNDLKATLGLVTNTDQRLYGHSSDNGYPTSNYIDSFFAKDDTATLMTNFYSLLDEVTTAVGTGTTPKMGASVMGMTNKVADYMTTKTPADIEDTMGDIMDALTEDVDPADGTKDFAVTFSKLMDLAAPMMAMADFPMWVHEGAYPGLDALETDYSKMNATDSTTSSLGNSAEGVNYLLSGMFDLLNGVSVDRAMMYKLISGLNSSLVDPVTAQKLIWNLSNYFTLGGYHYGSSVSYTNAGMDANVYNTGSRYNADGSVANATQYLYSNCDMKQTFKEFLTTSGPLFMMDKRRGSFAWKSDGSITSTDFPLTGLMQSVKKIYYNWDTTQLKESIYDLVRYDMFGRDRRNNTSAYSASILEHLLYLGAIAGNMGWNQLENAHEMSNAAANTYREQQNEHGHGAFCGYLTLNDSLFSIQGKKDSLAGIGTYELAFDSGNSYRNRGYDRTYRSRDSFTTGSRANYSFNFNPNYAALKFLTGACVGDFGVAAGGNTAGGGGNDSNEYMPYSANGVMTKDLASWTFGWVIRACWEGEGPYYSTQGASVSGATTTYYRPDGRIYATVTGGVYTYPVDGGNDVADPNPTAGGQRYNRYKPSWDSDYYMMETKGADATGDEKFYGPLDDNGDLMADETTTGPKCRHYTEITIADSDRACASYEEAIFRNFQWVMNEKKYILIIPLWLRSADDLNISRNLIESLLGMSCPLLPNMIQAQIESVVYQIIEGNGITGLSNARIFRDNSVWAKQNNTASVSTIPGDYRITVLATPIRHHLDAFGTGYVADDSILGLGLTLATVGPAKVYDDTLGRGTATPAGVSQNIFALSRFGFPRSKPKTVSSTYTHYLLGSRNVDNPDSDTPTSAVDTGFRNTGSVWAKRNSLLPLFIGLLAPLHTKSYYFSESNCNNALARQLEGLNFLLKPMIYFNYNAGTQDAARSHSGVAQNGWLPRIKGDGTWNEEYEAEHSRSLMSDWDVSSFDSSTSSAEAWHGGWGATDFYTPANLPTLLSVMMDSDTSPTRANRLQRADGLLGKLLEYDANTSTPNEPDRPAVSATAGAAWTPDTAAIQKFLYGLEQVTSGMKSTRAEGTQILEDQSGNIAEHSGFTDRVTNVTKQIDPPLWRFAKRPRIDKASKTIDLDLDDLLNKLVGEESDEMLNKYHDNAEYDATGGPTWTWAEEDGLNDTIDNLYTLTSKFMVEGAQYNISEYLFNILDVMSQHRLTLAQVKGLQYVLAKLLAYYDDESLTHQWVLQGEGSFNFLLDLLTVVLPNIDTQMGDYGALNHADDTNPKGRTYLNLLTALRNSTKANGFVPWIVDTVGISPYGSRDFITDLSLWLDSDLISGTNTKFYSTMARLLGDMGDQIELAPSEAGLIMIYEHYGYDGH